MNYAPNSQGPLYNVSQPEFNPCLLRPSIKKPSPCSCLNPQRLMPYNAWARAFGSAHKRLNVDGKLIEGDMCLYSCDNSGNNMMNPTPTVVDRPYVLPGAVPSAIKVFTNCGPCARS